MIYPLTIGGACILTSIIGTFFVKLGKSKNVMGALYKGFVVSALASLAILYPVTDFVLGLENEYNLNNKSFSGMDLYYCGVIGLIITGLLIWVTEYYTGTNYRPVKKCCKFINYWSWNKCNSRFSNFFGSNSYTSFNNCSWYFIN